jgi:DNA-binding GntR family transcriptional regulator
MKVIDAQPTRVEQVHRAILAEIAEGRLAPGTRLIQEQLAQQLGVSRQPVQQALILLRNQGLLVEAPGRGLLVAPLDPAQVRNLYDMRAVIEGLACRLAANSGTAAALAGRRLIEAGRAAVREGSVRDMIAADMAFHQFVYGLSGNPLIAPAMETHWSHAQRVMGEVLLRDGTPRPIWDQHEQILEAILAGDAVQAETLARRHISQAAEVMLERLHQHAGAPPA